MPTDRTQAGPFTLAEALARLQCQLPRIAKDAEGQAGNRPTKYADLPSISRQILPLLGQLGLSFTCWPTMRDGQFVLHYRLMFAPPEDAETECAEGFYPLPSSTPQTMGGAITYARRYALCAVTGVAPDDEDDDAQGAEELIQQAREMRRRPPEVDEHGAATVAEQTRMMTGREPGAERMPATPADDPWANGPAGLAPSSDPEDRPGTVSADQIKTLKALYGQLGISDRGKQLEVTMGTLKLDVVLPSHTRLSYRQGGALVGALQDQAAAEAKA
jgi:hypothetical protein